MSPWPRASVMGPSCGAGLTSTLRTDRPRLWTCATGSSPRSSRPSSHSAPTVFRCLRGDDQIHALRRLGVRGRRPEERDHEPRAALADLRRRLGQLGRARPGDHPHLPAAGVEQAGLSGAELGQRERAAEIRSKRVVQRAGELRADAHGPERVGDCLGPPALAHRLIRGEAGALEQRVPCVHEHRRDSGGPRLPDERRGLPEAPAHRLAAPARGNLPPQVGGDEHHEARGGG